MAKENKEERVLTEAEIQEKKLRDAAKARKRAKRIKSLISWIIVIAVVAALFTYYKSVKLKNEEKRNALMAQSADVDVKVEENVYTQTIDLSGYVEAYDTLKAKFRSTGAVTAVYVEEGDTVKAGQLLASIDNTSQLLNLESIRNDINQAEISGSVKQLELLKLKEKNAENALDYTNIYANFDGVVASVDVVVNDYFEAGSSVLTIIDRSKLKASVEIDEIDMQYVKVGQKAELTFDSLPGVTIEATVTSIPMIGRYTNQGIGVVDVELTIDNPPDELIPGFTFEGTIKVEGDVSVLLIPSAAVTTARGGVTTVNVKKESGEVETREVKVKYLGEGYCQVVSGLVKDEVITYKTSSGNGNFMGMMMGGGQPQRNR